MTHDFRRKPLRVHVPRVMVIDFRPLGLPAHWEKTSVLVEQYRAGMRIASGNLLIYQVARWVTVDSFPALDDGRAYDSQSYQAALRDDHQALRAFNGAYMMLDYRRLIEQYQIVERVESDGYDEIWMFGGPYFGFYESRMVGRGATWCNAPGLELNCRRFVMMGFNYERGVKEMIHNFGHRTESLVSQRFNSALIYGLYANPKIIPPPPLSEWEQWLIDHGTVHRTPGGVEYGQDERAWLAALRAEWWPYAIDPNLLGGNA